MSDTEDTADVRPWNLKNIPSDIRHASTKAAERTNTRLGDYVAQALREKIRRDRDANKQRPEVFDPHANMEAIERMVQLAMQLSQLNKGEPPPPALTRSIYALIGRRVRAIGEVGHTKLLTGPAADAPEK